MGPDKEKTGSTHIKDGVIDLVAGSLGMSYQFHGKNKVKPCAQHCFLIAQQFCRGNCYSLCWPALRYHQSKDANFSYTVHKYVLLLYKYT